MKRKKQEEFKFYSIPSPGANATQNLKTFSNTNFNVMKNDNLNWDNVVSVDPDNTNANTRKENFLKSRMLAENNTIFITGYIAHQHM